MKVHTMHWLEAMSILGMSRSTPGALERLYKWARDVGVDDTRVLAYDAYRFATFFADTIAEHPAMVTQVALPFAPLESTIYQLFHDHRELPTVMGGYEQKWSPSDLVRMFNSIAFSPDGKVFAAGSGDGNLYIWRTETGEKLFGPLEGHNAEVILVIFSPEGNELYSASEDGNVRIWDVRTGEEIGPVLQGHFNAVSAMSFSQDGSRLVSGAFKDNIQTWDVSESRTGELVRVSRHDR
ncbi:hypothetical protein PLEOSDRAFT_1048199, partial [Pleurotus ostreatus PC15]